MANPKEPCCPNCEGTEGYDYDMTETHKMTGYWGECGTASGGSGHYVKLGLAKCRECGKRFRIDALERKGLAGAVRS